MNNDYLIFLGLYLFSLVIRISYELLKKAGRVNPKNTVVFAVILVVMCLMWATWLGMCPLDPLRLALPEGVRWVGLGVPDSGTRLIDWSFSSVERRRNDQPSGNHRTVFRDPTSHVRRIHSLDFRLGHIYHGAFLSLIVGFVGIGNILFWRRLEEAELDLRYGENYRRYGKKTWF
jgi:protein-S-isoprenylcysteine O-methyltransferase Ste14